MSYLSVVEATIPRVDIAVEATFLLGHFPELFLIHTGFWFDSGPYCLEVFLRRNQTPIPTHLQAWLIKAVLYLKPLDICLAIKRSAYAGALVVSFQACLI